MSGGIKALRTNKKGTLNPASDFKMPFLTDCAGVLKALLSYLVIARVLTFSPIFQKQVLPALPKRLFFRPPCRHPYQDKARSIFDLPAFAKM